MHKDKYNGKCLKANLRKGKYNSKYAKTDLRKDRYNGELHISKYNGSLKNCKKRIIKKKNIKDNRQEKN